MYWARTNTQPRGSLQLSDIQHSLLGVAAVVTLLLIGALPAQAQTETVIYNFTGTGGDGNSPTTSILSDGKGNVFWASATGGLGGGPGAGSVFELSPDGQPAAIHQFTGPDGSTPVSDLIIDKLGNIYGTTAGGGSCAGVLFKLTPAGSIWTESVLYNLCTGATGLIHNLIMDAAGNIYGSGSFAVYQFSPSDSGWTETTISESVGRGCVGLTMNAAGNLYCPTQMTIVQLTPTPSGLWKHKVIHTFKKTQPQGGAVPGPGPLALDQAGDLYGATIKGGNNNLGTVYKLTAGTKVKWTFSVIHSFGGGDDGSKPLGPVVLDSAGNVYGTTSSNGDFGYGTVFELAPTGGGTYQHELLWQFHATDGAIPTHDLLLDSSGNIFGTASSGGSNGGGVLFEVTP